jgi:secondary thiamine-phosphate synthase enzyme
MLRQHLDRLELSTSGEGFHDLTGQLRACLTATGLQQGVLHLSVLHSSCSLTVNENADPRVLQDLAAYLQALVPEEGVRPISGAGPLRSWVHDDEGSDDMPAHIRTALTATSLSFSFERGRLLLGTWQAIYLWEHRRRPHRRQLCAHWIGS